jgi:hypothetical protein
MPSGLDGIMSGVKKPAFSENTVGSIGGIVKSFSKGLPSLPKLPSLPSIPALSKLPSLPSLPSVPSIASLSPSLPQIPSIGGAAISSTVTGAAGKALSAAKSLNVPKIGIK